MNRSLLIVGLLLIVAGLFVLNQGAHVLTPIAELTGLASQVQTERPIVSPTAQTVPASDYTFLSANLQGGVTAKGSLQVGNGQEIALYAMDEENFAQWQSKHTGKVILAKPMAISYNFTISPKASGTYYFIFDNQDTTKRVVIFSVSVLENTIVVSPVIENAGFELFALGIVLFAIGVRVGKGKPKPQETGVRCRFCRARIPTGETFCAKCGRAQT
jgi:hypothetical protein